MTPEADAVAEMSGWLVWAAAAAVAGCLVVAARLVMRLTRGQAVLPARPQRPVPWQGGDVLLVVIGYLQVALLAGAVVGVDPPTDRLLAANLVVVVAATAIAVAWLIGRGASLADLGLGGGQVREDALLALEGLGLVIAPLLALAAGLNAWVPYEHPVVDFLASRRDPLAIGLVIATAVFAAPLGEELFFRRILQGWLEKVFAAGRPWLAVIVSAAAFALAHRGQGLAYIPLFPLGIVLGLLVRQTGSLIPCILLHGMFNAVSIGLLLAEPAA